MMVLLAEMKESYLLSAPALFDESLLDGICLAQLKSWAMDIKQGVSDNCGSRIQLSNVNFVKILMSMTMQRLSLSVEEGPSGVVDVAAIVPLPR